MCCLCVVCGVLWHWLGGGGEPRGFVTITSDSVHRFMMSARDSCPEMLARYGCPRWLSEMAARDGCPRWLSEMLARDTCPRCLSEKHAREACPRRLPDMAARDGCPRCLGHIFEQFRAHRTLMNMDPKTEAKNGHKTAQKRWAPTVTIMQNSLDVLIGLPLMPSCS